MTKLIIGVVMEYDIGRSGGTHVAVGNATNGDEVLEICWHCHKIIRTGERAAIVTFPGNKVTPDASAEYHAFGCVPRKFLR